MRRRSTETNARTLEARIQRARELTGGQDGVDRFLKWKLPSGSAPEDDVVPVETSEDPDDEGD